MADTVDDLRAVLIETLELQDTPDEATFGADLLGCRPQLYSFRIIAIEGALKERFGITIDNEFGAAPFETTGSLTELFDAKRA
jgi:acyl carrier protein